MKMKIKKGFSLLELTLVLGVGTIVAFMKFQDMKNEQESILASAVGQQMKQIGEAVNGYINIRYDKLSTLSNAAGTGTDPGPRTCSGSVCEITYQTLINEGLLPSTYTGTNANKSSYKIILKRDGTTPNYVINGLITTSTAWIEGGKTRYDLLGNAMQTAGIDSGMTKTTSIASGHSGQWTETSANFNNITSTGQLAFRVGFNSALYSVYLRRDGTLPMTGDLNLDGHNINNVAALNATGNITTTGDLQARNIKATGKIDADGNISAGNWVWAKNGYGDAIGFGGDAGGGDYEIRLDNGTRYLSIYSPNAADYTTVLKVDRNAKIDQRLGLMGYDPNELPSGWGGGLRTLDVYAAGTVGTGSGGTVNAYMNSSGNIYASGNIEAAKNVKGATLESTGRATVGEFVQVNGTVSEGDSCSTNGLMGRTGNGTPMYCIDGYWTNIVSSKTKNGGMFLPGGMKMMWGTLSENLTDYGSLDGLSYFESKFKTYEPTFIANGKTYKFSNIFSVQFSPVDVGGAAMERMWGTPYSGSFSYAFSSAIKTTMTGTYLAIGY
ncbi:shufflon system plasmid conjugative transfer pilus tip adhesin PilV [Klebsiella pneumoniae]|uniref:shufflon system plasmid conjugative transfer pilus tip adhesin PilV n=2 Tax=Enterobacteriaceae TaxID=543 RepID=UPI000E3E94B1|nr:MULTISPECIES: shufflon system plasmid conjugative transfer pilus tip adhesin PilV [Enterobacteriaceae]HBH7054591.1 shufflon system plasmid conjugative transfer pilus tip adhesin PilV [Serratia marcescens]EFJ8960473.1 shufflon system plasmid conjugative transfer pilus tip adhesin PilV [Escherichia coli]EIO7606363.1 shufflon system plasmid conjugative transfer pilus tip adhesin PilV [Escherichia coli]EJA7635718.1 shufflon system plasmid conjugative transfer pilus tip adhesin PilV [Escherichia 